MKFTLLLCAAILLSLSLTAMTSLAAEKPDPKSELLHVVSFKFKDTASAADIEKVEKAFRALKDQIPLIKKLVWGKNNSPEGLNKGCTHAWVLTFTSEADRDAYLIHPDHKKFGGLVGPLLADVFVVDFWTRE